MQATIYFLSLVVKYSLQSSTKKETLPNKAILEEIPAQLLCNTSGLLDGSGDGWIIKQSALIGVVCVPHAVLGKKNIKKIALSRH